MSISIQAFYSPGKGEGWKPLPETSQYLTEKQLVPNAGDAVTLAGKDGVNMGLEPTGSEHIMTVKTKWLNYASADVAVLLHYVPF